MQWSVGISWLRTSSGACFPNWRLHGDASLGGKPDIVCIQGRWKLKAFLEYSCRISPFFLFLFPNLSYLLGLPSWRSRCLVSLQNTLCKIYILIYLILKYWRRLNLAVLCLGESAIHSRLFWACAPGWASPGIKLPGTSRSRIWSCQGDNFQFFLSQTHVKERNIAIRKLAVPRRMRNEYRVKQRLPKRVMWQISPPPIHCSRSSASLALHESSSHPPTSPSFSVRSWASPRIKLPSTSCSRIWSCQRDNFQFFLSQTCVKERNIAIRKPSIFVIFISHLFIQLHSYSHWVIISSFTF